MWLHFGWFGWFLCLVTQMKEKLYPGPLCSSSGMVSFQLLSQEINYIFKTKNQTVPVLGIEHPMLHQKTFEKAGQYFSGVPEQFV